METFSGPSPNEEKKEWPRAQDPKHCGHLILDYALPFPTNAHLQESPCFLAFSKH